MTAAASSFGSTVPRPPRVWGYRNVWCRFESADVNVIVAGSLLDMAALEKAFGIAFESQRDAQFPSPELDGTFSELANRGRDILKH